MSTKASRISQPLGIASTLICLMIAVVRGGNPVAIKLVLQSLPPMQGASIRVAIGCASVGIIGLVRGEDLRPRWREVGPLASLSVVYAVQISAMQVGSDLTSPLFVAILFNTYPIIANLTSSFFVPEDRLNPRRAIGLAVAFAGMAWVFSARTESVLAPNPVVGNALILFAATLLGMRMVYTRQFVLRVPYARAVFWPMVGSLPLFLLGDAAIAGGMVRSESTWETWVALAYQGIVVGGAGQLAWVYLLRKHTPGTVIAFSFLTPVSGVAQGAAYFDEPVPARLVTGLAAVLAGIALAAKSAPPVRRSDRTGAQRALGGSP